MSRPFTAVVNINLKVRLSFNRRGDKSLVGFTTLPLASASWTLYWGQVTHHLSGLVRATFSSTLTACGTTRWPWMIKPEKMTMKKSYCSCIVGPVIMI